MKMDEQGTDSINSHLRELQNDALHAASTEQADNFMDRINSLLRELSTEALVTEMIDTALDGADLAEDVSVVTGMPESLLEVLAADPVYGSLCELC